LLGYNPPINKSLINSREAEIWNWQWWAGTEEKHGDKELQRTSVLHSYGPLQLLPHIPIWLPDEESTCKLYTSYVHSESLL